MRRLFHLAAIVSAFHQKSNPPLGRCDEALSRVVVGNVQQISNINSSFEQDENESQLDLRLVSHARACYPQITLASTNTRQHPGSIPMPYKAWPIDEEYLASSFYAVWPRLSDMTCSKPQLRNLVCFCSFGCWCAAAQRLSGGSVSSAAAQQRQPQICEIGPSWLVSACSFFGKYTRVATPKILYFCTE